MTTCSPQPTQRLSQSALHLLQDSDEDSELEAMLNEEPVFSQSPQASQQEAAVCKQDNKKGSSNHNDDDEESHIEQEAQRKAKFLPLAIATKIASVDALCWHCPSTKRSATSKTAKDSRQAYPVRLATPDEAVGLIDKQWNEQRQALVQYLGAYTPNQYTVVLKSQLKPYHGNDERNTTMHSSNKATIDDQHDTSTSNDKHQQSHHEQRWCPTLVRAYIKGLSKRKGKTTALTAVQLRVEELYLAKLLERVLQLGQKQEQDEGGANCKTRGKSTVLDLDETIAADNNNKNANSANDDDVKHDNGQEDATATATQIANPLPPPCRPSLAVQSLQGELDKNQKFRAGDVIEYTHPQFVCGHAEGYRCTQIVNIQKGVAYKLVLQNDDLLPKDHPIRRVGRLVRNKIVPHNGMIKPIEAHTPCEYGPLSTCGTSTISQEAKRVSSIIDANLAKHQPALEATGVPLDILQNTGKQVTTKTVGNSTTETTTSVAPTATDRTNSGQEEEKKVEDDQKDSKMPATKSAAVLARNGKRKASVLMDEPDNSGSAGNGEGEHGGNVLGRDEVESSANRAAKRARGAETGEKSSRDCRAYLQEELAKFQTQSQQVGGSRRRARLKCHSTMTDSQLTLAMDVWREMDNETTTTTTTTTTTSTMTAKSRSNNISLEEAVNILAKDTGVDRYRLEKFLSGDEQRLMRTAHHVETEAALKEWKSKKEMTT